MVAFRDFTDALKNRMQITNKAFKSVLTQLPEISIWTLQT
jgi:hypothetical protein